MTERSFVCETCGQTHQGFPTDYGFKLPDVVHGLKYVERYLRSRSNADLCTLDESRHFFRGIVPVPLAGSDEEFCWGIWVEVPEEQHDAYAHGFRDDLSGLPRFHGRLANDIPGYGGTIDLQVEVQFQAGKNRPVFKFPDDASHALALEQRGGISRRRHHDILDGVGFFAEKDGA